MGVAAPSPAAFAFATRGNNNFSGMEGAHYQAAPSGSSDNNSSKESATTGYSINMSTKSIRRPREHVTRARDRPYDKWAISADAAGSLADAINESVFTYTGKTDDVNNDGEVQKTSSSMETFTERITR